MDLWSVLLEDQAPGCEVTADGLPYIVGADGLISRFTLELAGALEVVRGGRPKGLGLERYRATRLCEGGLDEFERKGRIGVFARIEARQVDGTRRAKLDRLTGRHAIPAAEMLQGWLRL